MNLTMHLIEILLPVSGPDGVEFPATKFERLARELTEKFGGVTSFTRSPAEGRWKTQGGTEHDDIVVMEVMAETLDRYWLRHCAFDCCASSTRRSWSSAPKRSRSCDFWRTSPLAPTYVVELAVQKPWGPNLNRPRPARSARRSARLEKRDSEAAG